MRMTFSKYYGLEDEIRNDLEFFYVTKVGEIANKRGYYLMTKM